MTADEVSEADVRAETIRLALWYETPRREVELWHPGDRVMAVRGLPDVSPDLLTFLRRRPDCENCHAPASGRLEGHPLCRFCRTQGDPERKYRWEGL